MVEPQPSKLMTRVRFPSPAPAGCEKVYAHVAQSVEHLLGKEEVAGSIPVVGTISKCFLTIAHASEAAHVQG